MSQSRLTPRCRPSRTSRRCGSLIRQVKPTPGSQLDLFARYSYQAFITDLSMGRRWNWRPIIAATPRSRTPYATSSTASRLNHMPSTSFAANGARLPGEVMAGITWPAGPRGLVWATRTVIVKDDQAAGLRSGGTVHPLGAHPHLASPPSLALGNPVQSRLGPATKPFRSQIHGQPATDSTSPQSRATSGSLESPAAYPLAIPRMATPA